MRSEEAHHSWSDFLTVKIIFNKESLLFRIMIDVSFLFYLFTDLGVRQEENTAYTPAGRTSAKCDYTRRI